MVTNRVGNRGIGKASNAGVEFRSKRIQAGLSTQIVIKVDGGDGEMHVVGGIQKMTYNQTRPLAPLSEVGTDGLVGIVPNGAAIHKLTINRMVFDFQRLTQSLQREYRHIHSQRKPFDIVVTDYNPYLGQESPAEMNDLDDPAGGGNRPLSLSGEVGNQTEALQPTEIVETVFHNCWFESSSINFDNNSYQIIEDAGIQCEHVYDNQVVTTLSAVNDSLESATNTSQFASVMSSYDSTLK